MGFDLELLEIVRGINRPSLLKSERPAGDLEGRKMANKTGANRNILVKIFHVITDSLRSLLYSSKKTSQKATLQELYTFRQSSYVGAGAIGKLAEAINSDKQMQVDSNGIFRMCRIQYPKVEGNKLIGIPVVLDGGFFGLAPDHIVTFVFDPKSQTLEYYDSKGLTIEERGDAKTIQGKTLKEIADEMKAKYSADTLMQNSARHQRDIHNCGIYVSDYLLRRSQGESFDDIQKAPLTFAAANGQRRQDLIDYVEAKFPHQARN